MTDTPHVARPLSWVQWLLYYVNFVTCWFTWRVRDVRPLPIAKGQGAVIIANHRSSLDPCVIQYATGPRVVHWMVAQLYAPDTFIGRILAKLETIPIGKSGHDIGAIKAAVRYAKAGELVGMLPEGNVNKTTEFMRPVRPGAIVVALTAGVPVVPIYIEGAPYHPVPWRPLFKRGRVRIVIGDPIDLSAYHGQQRNLEVVSRLTLECVRAIAKLAECEDFEPTIAGRGWKDWTGEPAGRV